jgi:uncharacterized protein (TIGR03086 family)
VFEEAVTLAMTDPIDRLARAVDQTAATISRVRRDQAGLPTPCRSWDVRALVNHVVHDVQQFTAMAGGGKYQKDDADVIGEDWAGAYGRAADALLGAWRREGALDRTVQLPSGEVPATWSVGQQVADLVVHGWDLAKATGQSTELDPELGEFSLDWGKDNLQPEFRGDEASGRVFGPEVSLPEDAPVYDRLAAFWGRDPDQHFPSSS